MVGTDLGSMTSSQCHLVGRLVLVLYRLDISVLPNDFLELATAKKCGVMPRRK